MVGLNSESGRPGVADRDWQPLAPGTLDSVAKIFDQLGDHAAIGRQPASFGHVYTVTGHRAGVAWAGQGGSIGEALRDIRAIA